MGNLQVQRSLLSPSTGHGGLLQVAMRLLPLDVTIAFCVLHLFDLLILVIQHVLLNTDDE